MRRRRMSPVFRRRSTVRSTLTCTALAALLLAGSFLPARGDRRAYVWTYEYQTKPPGGTEVEHYLTSRTGDLGAVGGTSWEHRLELEAGLTDRWDVSIYQIFLQPAEEGFRFDSFQLRTRYRLGESGLWPVDPLLYLEYRRPRELVLPNKLEGKLILARDFGRMNLALNLVEEVAFAPGSEWETGYTAGAGYEPHPVIRIGAEVFGDLVKEGELAHYLGPTISVARGGWFYTVGLGFGVNEHASDLQARAILGVDL
jgi:hypothetical protein